MTYYLKLFLLFGVPIAGGLLSRKFWQAALIGAAFGACIAFDLYGVKAFDFSGGFKGPAYSLVATAVFGAGLVSIVHGVSRFFRNKIPERGRFYLQCWAVLLALLMLWFVAERLAQGVDEPIALRWWSWLGHKDSQWPLALRRPEPRGMRDCCSGSLPRARI